MQKVGGELSFREDYLFWRLAHYFVSDQNFRIVKQSQTQNEIWLEKMENKQVQLIRLLRYDLDWSNWLQADMEQTARNAEGIRQRFRKRKLNMLNIYVSAYPPVDDYEFHLSKPLIAADKTTVSTLIFEQSNVEQATSKLNQALHSSFSIALTHEYEESEVNAIKQETFSLAKHRATADANMFRQGKPFFTYVFIAMQVIVFLLLELNGGSTNTATLLRFGAKFNPLIVDGEWWRFFTPIILHIGFLHLAMNTLALYYLGTAVESIFGRTRFLFIYVVAGFFGSLASFVFSPSISAGASGAIFGCFGSLLYFGVTYPRLFFRTMGMNILIVIGINLIFGFTVPGIDNAGHLGGLVGGFLATGIVHFPKKRKLLLQTASMVIATTAIIGLLHIGYKNVNAEAMDDSTIFVLVQQYIHAEEFEKSYDLLAEYMENNEAEASLETYISLAFVEMRLEMYQDAKQHLQYVLSQNNDFAEAHYYLAAIYGEEGNLDQAITHAETAVRLHPNDPSFQDLLERLKYFKGIGGEEINLH